MVSKMLNNKLNKAYCEVYDIVQHLEPEILKKIPQTFIDVIEKNRDQRISSKNRL